MQETRHKSKLKSSKKSPPSALKSHTTSADKAARFKEEKHLSIETRDLGHGDVAPGAGNVSSVSKKRRRRLAAEIDRKYKCPFAACQKAYGSEGSLIHHQKLKHPEHVDRREKESQVGTLLLPLHRNVTIRPATPLMAIANQPKLLLCSQRSGLHGHMPSSSDAPPAAKASRRSTRSRSNSEPVALLVEKANPKVFTPCAKLISKAYPKVPRKPRRVATTTSHAMKTEATARRTKLRSKSESLSEMNPLCQRDELSIPMFGRSNDMTIDRETIVPPRDVSSSADNESFKWPGAAVPGSGIYTTTSSSDEQAIDSDILSVLANCDTGNPPISHFEGGPPAIDSYQPSSEFGVLDDTEMLSVGSDCFKIAEDAALPIQISQIVTNEPDADLGFNASSIMGDEWSNALLLSNHLEKMSMAPGDTSPHSTISTFGNEVFTNGVEERVRSASEPVPVAAPIYPPLHHVSSMPLDVALAKPASQLTGDIKLGGHQDTDFPPWFSYCSAPKATKARYNRTHQMLWELGENACVTPNLQQASSDALDQLLQYDDTLGWKPADVFEGDAEVDYALGDTEMTMKHFRL